MVAGREDEGRTGHVDVVDNNVVATVKEVGTGHSCMNNPWQVGDIDLQGIVHMVSHAYARHKVPYFYQLTSEKVALWL